MTCQYCQRYCKTKTCGTCKTKRYRQRNPIRYAYHTHKDNAKRRGIEFSLTFEQFKAFAVEYNLIVNKGKTKQSLTIDRIDCNRGYMIDNIQAMSLSDNSTKGNYEKKIKYVEGAGLRTVQTFNYNTSLKEPF